MEKKTLKNKTWLAKLKNIYANIQGNTYLYTNIVKRLEVNILKC